MVHLDLFSGIGGFAYAVDQVWDNVEHIFCDNDKFCQQVLNKHWKGSTIYDDIKEITADTWSKGLERHELRTETKRQSRKPDKARQDKKPFLLTGGFPCQPFSAAGVRRGTADDRYLWPEMLRVIQLTKPTWVIAENVRGLLTWNEGMVFEQVCLDLEASGYEVQPFIIPAVAVNAPHRRDRIWFVAHRTDNGRSRRWSLEQRRHSKNDEIGQTEESKPLGQGWKRELGATNTDVKDTVSQRSQRRSESSRQILERQKPEIQDERPDWSSNWFEVATELCGVDDGFPKGMDRANQIKAYGNAIVPQVATQIMKGIHESTKDN